jgi:hypothetical protein
MTKRYNEAKTLYESGLNVGDSVVIKYKDSKHFMKTGRILSIRSKGPLAGDCLISLHYDDEPVEFFYTMLEKVEELVEIPSGEIIYILEADAMEVAMAGLIKYDYNSKFFYFYKKDRWQLEYFEI